jgi:hypothetical protein
MMKNIFTKFLLVGLLCFVVLYSDVVSVSAGSTDAKEEVRYNLMISLQETFSDYSIDDTSNWIEIYDFNGESYAYFVRLFDKDNKLSGFTIPNSITQTPLVTLVGEPFVNYANYISYYKESNPKYQLIYDFPYSFYIKDERSTSKISSDGSLQKIYEENIYKNNTVAILKELSEDYSTEEYTTKSLMPTLYGTLDNWQQGENEFVPVYDPSNQGTYYGGKQSWLEDEGVSSFYANRACGTIAAANMMHYMSKYVSGKSNLYDKVNIYKDNFSEYQKDVYDYIKPGIFGIETINDMINKVEDFADSKNVSLNPVINNSSWSEIKVRNYVSTGLSIESPVLLLTWNSPISTLDYHWVTVTRLYKPYGTYNATMVTSNWGAMQEYDFSVWVNSSSVYKGVIYFE